MNNEKNLTIFLHLANELLRMVEKLDNQCRNQDEKDKLAIIYQEFLAKFMK